MIHIIKRYLKAYTLDKSAFVQIVLAPILLIFILGNALASDDVQRNMNMKVGILDKNESLTAVLIETFDQAEVKFEKITEDQDYAAFLRNHSAIIEVTDNYTLIQSTHNALGGKVVKQILETLALRQNAYLIDASYDNKSFESNMNKQLVSFGDISPSPMEYYSVTLMVMSLMISMSYGVSMIYSEVLEHRGMRLRSSAIPEWQVYFAISISIMLLMSLMSMVIILVTKYLFAVRWTDNMFFLFLVINGFAFIGANIGMIVGTFSKDGVQAGHFVGILLPAFTILSGGYFRFNSSSKIVSFIQSMVPNYKMQELTFALNYTKASGPIREGLIYMVVMVVLTSILLLNRVKKVKI